MAASYLRPLPLIVWMGFLLGLGGCRQEAEQADAPPASAPRPLVILTWDEYFSPDVISQFEESHGIPVEFVTFANLDEMEGLLRSRRSDFDLVVIDGGTLADLIELQMLQEVQLDKIPNFNQLDPRFLNLKFDPNNTYSVPYMWGTTLIAYRSDKIEQPRMSWRALWDERYRDRSLMLDDKFDVYAAALLAQGYDINTQDLDELDQATELLLEQAAELGTRFVDIFEIRDRIIKGDCWITMTYSSDAAVLAEEEPNIAYFIPEEGAPLWLDSFGIPRESTNSEAAHLFLDFICRPEVAAANSNELWCASVNQGARQYLSEEILEDPTLYLSQEVLARCHFDVQSTPERQRAVNQGLKRVYDKVRELDAQPKVSLLIWENYLLPEAVAQFEKKFQAKLVVTEVANSEQLKQALSSRPAAYDLIVADEHSMRELRDLKLLGELDPDFFSSIPQHTEEFLQPVLDLKECTSIPYLWGLTVLAGRPEVFKGQEPSWNLLWREDLRVAVLDEPNDLFWVALLSLGHDPAKATKEQIEQAAQLISRRFPKLPEAMKDATTALNELEAGQLDLIISYSGDALSRAARTGGIDVVLPKEGAPLWVDSFALTRNAKSPELAKEFIRFMISPEISAQTTAALFYASPNPEARPRLQTELVEHPVLFPSASALRQCRFIRFEASTEKHVHQALLRIFSGSPLQGMVHQANPELSLKLSGFIHRDDSRQE